MAEAERIFASRAKASPHAQRRARSGRSLIEIISSQIDLLRKYHVAVLDTEATEAVHKMRVTTRRLQASLDLLEDQLSAPKLKRRLRRWRRALSLVRNYDVFLELMEQESPSRGQVRQEQFQLVKNTLQQQRVKTASKVRPLLERIDIDKIALTLGLQLSQTEAVERAANEVSSPDHTQAKQTGKPAMVIDERRVVAYAADRLDQRIAEFQALVAQSHPATDPAELHQLRIAAKRARYLLETVSQMGHGDASRTLRWLKTLQDRIGDWHDFEALEEEIITIVSSREFMKEHLAESGRMLQAAAHLQKKKEVLVSKLFPIRVPQHVAITSQRIARSLRRHGQTQ